MMKHLKKLYNIYKTVKSVRRTINISVDLLSGFLIVISDHPEIIAAWAGVNIGLGLHMWRMKRKQKG